MSKTTPLALHYPTSFQCLAPHSLFIQIYLGKESSKKHATAFKKQLKIDGIRKQGTQDTELQTHLSPHRTLRGHLGPQQTAPDINSHH